MPDLAKLPNSGSRALYVSTGVAALSCSNPSPENASPLSPLPSPCLRCRQSPCFGSARAGMNYRGRPPASARHQNTHKGWASGCGLRNMLMTLRYFLFKTNAPPYPPPPDKTPNPSKCPICPCLPDQPVNAPAALTFCPRLFWGPLMLGGMDRHKVKPWLCICQSHAKCSQSPAPALLPWHFLPACMAQQGWWAAPLALSGPPSPSAAISEPLQLLLAAELYVLPIPVECGCRVAPLCRWCIFR